MISVNGDYKFWFEYPVRGYSISTRCFESGKGVYTSYFALFLYESFIETKFKHKWI